jgi:hypothetical protein
MDVEKCGGSGTGDEMNQRFLLIMFWRLEIREQSSFHNSFGSVRTSKDWMKTLSMSHSLVRNGMNALGVPTPRSI